ncbi:hypothetical protein KR222_004561, partial [Zaprionus bogoriensis]
TVKRSTEEDATVPPANKKSSPEIVPASFSNAPAARSSAAEQSAQSQAQAQSQPQALPQSGLYALPSNDEILAAVAAAAAQGNQQQQQQLQSDPSALEEAVASSTMRKRGINYEYNPYVVPAGNDYGADLPSGIWTDDYEPLAAAAAPLSYNGGNYNANYNGVNNERELQELDDYVPERHGKQAALGSWLGLSSSVSLLPALTVSSAGGRNKAYDNLQNLLNAEAYLESIPLSVPLTYANRNYNLDERNKRGIYYNLANSEVPAENINLNKYRRYGDMRLKRDTTKLTPADMLALVALVEAGERARKESDVESGISVPLVDAEEMDYVPPGSWFDAPAAPAPVQQQAPALVDYYGLPVEAQVVPKYEYVPRPQKYMSNSNSRFGSSKRFMVSKKKRSVSQSQFLNEPVGERGPSYYGEKFY